MQFELLQLDLLNKFGLIKKYLYEKWNFNVGSGLFNRRNRGSKAN